MVWSFEDFRLLTTPVSILLSYILPQVNKEVYILLLVKMHNSLQYTKCV